MMNSQVKPDGPLAQQIATVQGSVDSLLERAPQLSEEEFASQALVQLFVVVALLSVIERHLQDMETALRLALPELDDAMKAAVNQDWSQEDYDAWDSARRHIEELLAALSAASTGTHQETK